MNKYKTRTNIITNGGLGLALAILILLGGITYRDMAAARAAAQEVDHTYTVLEKLDEVFSALKDAEAGQRGYVITGKKEYLDPYYKATRKFDRKLSDLHDLTRDNPRQQKTINGIELVMRGKMAALGKLIAIRGSKGHLAAVRLAETGSGEKFMDDIRTKVTEARDEETRLLKERFAARGLAAHHLGGAILTGGLLSLALLLTVFYFLKSESIRRLKAEEELRRHQEGLENLVDERTRDLAVANTHLKEEIAMREKAEHTVRKTMEDLARSNRELDQFASIASHDLQSPLRAVAGFVELLKERYGGKLDERADEYITRAVSGTKRMSVLIHDLYVYSRIGTKEKQFSRVKMGALLEGAVDNLKEIIDENEAVITHGTLPEVEGDDTQLIQLFQNLISNAIKFRKKDVPPVIQISAERKEDKWVFCVHDNGIGIEPLYYERIFVIFQRLHTKEEYPGTGLGLALCRKIVERHGGRIWIESRPGEGSDFYFTMPTG